MGTLMMVEITWMPDSKLFCTGFEMLQGLKPVAKLVNDCVATDQSALTS